MTEPKAIIEYFKLKMRAIEMEHRFWLKMLDVYKSEDTEPAFQHAINSIQHLTDEAASVHQELKRNLQNIRAIRGVLPKQTIKPPEE